MPLPKKWRMVTGTMTVAAVLSAGVAGATSGRVGDDIDLNDAVAITEVQTTTTVFTGDGAVVTDADDSLDSPFDEAVEPADEESADSGDSPESDNSEDSGDSENSENTDDSDDADDSEDADDSGNSENSDESDDSDNSEDTDDAG